MFGEDRGVVGYAGAGEKLGTVKRSGSMVVNLLE